MNYKKLKSLLTHAYSVLKNMNTSEVAYNPNNHIITSETIDLICQDQNSNQSVQQEVETINSRELVDSLSDDHGNIVKSNIDIDILAKRTFKCNKTTSSTSDHSKSSNQKSKSISIVRTSCSQKIDNTCNYNNFHVDLSVSGERKNSVNQAALINLLEDDQSVPQLSLPYKVKSSTCKPADTLSLKKYQSHKVSPFFTDYDNTDITNVTSINKYNNIEPQISFTTSSSSNKNIQNSNHKLYRNPLYPQASSKTTLIEQNFHSRQKNIEQNQLNFNRILRGDLERADDFIDVESETTGHRLKVRVGCLLGLIISSNLV